MRRKIGMQADKPKFPKAGRFSSRSNKSRRGFEESTVTVVDNGYEEFVSQVNEDARRVLM